MKRTLTFLALLTLPMFATAASKDVNVTNEVDVNVKRLPASSLKLLDNFDAVELRCVINPGSHLCSNSTNPSSSSEKLIHWATLSVLADPGFTCRASLSAAIDLGTGTSIQRVLTAYATGSTPGSATISFPHPIRIGEFDALHISLTDLTFVQDGCEAEAIVGVEVVTP